MNRWWLPLFCVLGSALTLTAAPLRLDSLKVGSRTFRNVTVIGANATDLYFSHSDGISNVKLRLLSPDLQKRFDYDPQEAVETERQKAREDQAYYDMLAQELTSQAQRRLKAAREAAASSELNVADPISDQSLINKTAPKLDVEKWMGEKPYTAGKNILVFFWTTWSKPCQKMIPDLNAMQTKFSEQLVIVAICPQPEEDVREYKGPALDFTTAVDPDGKVTAVAGVTSVPFALLVDDKGIVRYQGHPGALNQDKLGKLIGAPVSATPTAAATATPAS